MSRMEFGVSRAVTSAATEVTEWTQAAGEFGGGDHFPCDEGGAFVGGLAAVLLLPLLFIEAFIVNAFQEGGARFSRGLTSAATKRRQLNWFGRL